MKPWDPDEGNDPGRRQQPLPRTAADQLLDEDGRCRRTDLLPSDCGCAAHRGGEVVDLEEAERKPRSEKWLRHLTVGVLIAQFRTAKYDGWCKLDSRHKVEAGSEIGLAVQEDDLNDEIGWVCELCVRTMLA